jgi:hypothetical protein
VRQPKLGYYCIVTDTKETERNYFNGLRDSLPEHQQRMIVIKVHTKDRKVIVDACNQVVNNAPNPCIPWIVIDRDDFGDFDTVIEQAEHQGINVGWSNPCIELWFEAYFGNIAPCSSTKECQQRFKSAFKKKCHRDYTKSDKAIYRLLTEYGNEQLAITRAEERREHLSGESGKPSSMCACTSVDVLVSEIRRKTNPSR